jgi:hypothetical protein
VYSEKKERRTSMTETIHEVDEEEDSPIRSDDASNWHAEEAFIASNHTTAADDSSQSTNSSPMQSITSPSLSTAHVSPASNSTTSPMSVKHFESPVPPSNPNPTQNSSAAINKYDSTKHKSSYQSAVTEQKKDEVVDKKDETVAKIVTAMKAVVNIPPHSDLKERLSPSPQDSKEVKESTATSPDKNTQVNIVDKNKSDKISISNENNPSTEHKEHSRTSSLPELNIVSRNAPPLVPARNNFSPYLTPPLGSEEEETLEVRLYFCTEIDDIKAL